MKELEILKDLKIKLTELKHREVIDTLIKHRDISFDYQDDLYLLKANLISLDKMSIRGTHAYEDILKELNKINFNILTIINNIEYNSINKATKSTCKIPVSYYLPTEKYNDVANFVADHSSGVIVISGPSGSGKSVLASYIYHNLFSDNEKQWFNCNFKFDTEDLKEAHNLKLVVLDNICLNHAILKTDIFSETTDLFLIITTFENKVCNKVRLETDFCNNSFLNVFLDSYQPIDAFSFLRKSIPKTYIHDEHLQILCKRIYSLPILWQLTSDIIKRHIEESIIEENEITMFDSNQIVDSLGMGSLNSSSGIKSVSKKIVNAWFKSNKITEIEKQILEILAKIPMIGMSPNAMSFLFQSQDSKLIKQNLSNLQKLGLIKVYSNRQVKNEQIIQSHELFKKIDLIEGDSLNKYKERYMTYVDSIEGDTDLATKIDVIVLRIKSEFEQWVYLSPNETFINSMNTHFKLIQDNIPVNSNSQLKSEWIAKLFCSIINQETTCSILIGFGQALSRLTPNKILGETIWEGRNSYDAWARGCCINAAVHHWIDLGQTEKKEKLDSLFFWFKIELWKVESRHYDRADLDIAAFLAGLCRLGDVDLAIRTINSSKFNNYILNTHVSILTLILYMIDSEHPETERIFNRHFHKIEPSSAKKNLIEYADMKNYSFKQMETYEKPLEEKDMGLSMAVMAGSNEFYEFSLNKGEKTCFV